MLHEPIFKSGGFSSCVSSFAHASFKGARQSGDFSPLSFACATSQGAREGVNFPLCATLFSRASRKGASEGGTFPCVSPRLLA